VMILLPIKTYTLFKKCSRGVLKNYNFYFQFHTTDDEKLLNGPVVELVRLDSTALVCSIFQYHLLGVFFGFQENSFCTNCLFVSFCFLKSE
jgi:hypothetical protein